MGKEPEKKPEAPKKAVDGKVRVKFLKHVMQWEPGQEADFDESVAASLCKETAVAQGNGELSVVRRAVRVDSLAALDKLRLEQIEALKLKPVHDGGLTQDELHRLGMKNTVVTPQDKAFEAQLARAKEAVEKRSKVEVKAKSQKDKQAEPEDEDAA